MSKDSAVLQEHSLVQHRLDVLDEVGRNDNGRVLAVVGNDGVQDVVPGRRVHAADGLIQQVEPGIPAHGKDELDFLLVALGKALEGCFGRKLQLFQHLIRLGGVEVSVEIPEHLHQLLHPHPVGQPLGVRQIGDDGLGIRAGSHQLYVLENSHPDPTEGRFIYKGQLRTSADQSWAVDASVFTHRDSLYLVWFGIPEQPIPYIFNCIYIARLENPWTLATRPVMIGIPDQRWERHDPEAAFSMGSPQPLKSPDGNLIHLVYSAGGNRPPYSALGLMTAQSGSNLLDPASWKKSPQPVFCQNDTLGVFGPEHCSFIKSPDGTEDYIFYHARYRLEPAANDLRTPRLQKFSWDKKGFPVFGQPIPCHVKQPKPSGTAI
mgnify:CR=1 FL=1